MWTCRSPTVEIFPNGRSKPLRALAGFVADGLVVHADEVFSHPLGLLDVMRHQHDRAAEDLISGYFWRSSSPRVDNASSPLEKTNSLYRVFRFFITEP